MTHSEHNEDRINHIIEMLSEMDVDGETMQYIVEQVGMEDQMLRQLVMRSTSSETGGPLPSAASPSPPPSLPLPLPSIPGSARLRSWN